MTAPSDLELLHGTAAEPSAGVLLAAGPVEALLVDGDLRYIRVGGVEVARRVYAGIRDPVWDTIPGERTEPLIERGPDGFRVTFDSVHRTDEIAFGWRCEIVGSADGTISYSLDGAAERDSTYQRIGLCVLHPTDVFAGAPFEATTPDGPLRDELPAGVGPQMFVDGVYPPLVPGFERIRMTSPDGTVATFAFEGDLFEIEDQRNWTDASFKSYSRSPPTGVDPWPLAAGTPIRQRLTLSVERASAAPPVRDRSSAEDDVVELRLEDGEVGRVPQLGLAIASEPGVHTVAAVERLRALGLAHLRVDLRLDAGAWREALAGASALAGELACGLEVAAFFPAGDRSAAAELAALLGGGPPVERLLAFEAGASSTPVELVRAVRAACGPSLAGVPIGGGTDVYFAELNRVGALPADFEVLAWPVTPQVHADDDLSLVETPMAQADTVLQGRASAPGAAIAVTPITLRPRYNPDAPDAATPAGSLPGNVDRRQVSLIAAAWTLASVARLGVAGAASATYFETVGWRGVIEADAVAADRAPFPSIAGMVFPVYDVLRELAPLAGRPLRGAASSAPLALAAARVAAPDGERLIVANLRSRPLIARIGPLPGRPRLRRLTLAAVRERPCEPRPGTDAAGPEPAAGGRLDLPLGAYELAILSWDGG